MDGFCPATFTTLTEVTSLSEATITGVSLYCIVLFFLLQNHPYAISALGWIALEKERNFTKAAEMFQQAKDLDFRDAGYYLGHMHHFGLLPNASHDLVSFM